MKPTTKRFYRRREALRTFIALVAAFCIWAPCVHRLFERPVANYRPAGGNSVHAQELADAQVAIWLKPSLQTAELGKLRKINPEWDFMSRTYFVLSMANMALRDDSYRTTACRAMDAVIEDTLKHEQQGGCEYFLLPYGHREGWMAERRGSVFVDGEIALMLASRRMVEEKLAYKPLLQHRVRKMVAQMSESPVLCAESYPNECWIFCNSIAIASIRMADALDGTDHSKFVSSWLRLAKSKLIEPKTGLLISAFSFDGSPAVCGAGGEGSSIWMVSHMLQVVDPEFALKQYRLARKALSVRTLGFSYALEWPKGSDAGLDIDSGPIAPLLNVSPSSTALAAVAAAAFDDDDYFRGILASIQFGGMPVRRNGGLTYKASNLVGDAVLLYAMTEGPLWNAVHERTQQQHIAIAQ